MSDKDSWQAVARFIKPVNPVRACATYEQIEAQNRKNDQRYSGSPGLWVKDKGVDIATDKAMSRLKEEYMRTE